MSKSDVPRVVNLSEPGNVSDVNVGPPVELYLGRLSLLTANTVQYGNRRRAGNPAGPNRPGDKK